MLKKYGFLLLFPAVCYADTRLADPCASLLALLNRPTVADSVCVVKDGEKIIEAGAQYANAYPHDGHIILLPQMQSRFGLPYSLEFTFLPSSYVYEYSASDSDHHGSGYTATTLGMKYQFPDNGRWIYAAESLVTLPMGDADFGSEGFGVTVNGIVEYIFDSNLSLTFMFGIASLTAPSNQGGGRFTTVNPDLVFAWQPLSYLQFYAEIYGQSKTAPNHASGFNGDLGIQYLVLDYIEIDLEYGQRFSGELGGFSSYVGAGGGVMF